MLKYFILPLLLLTQTVNAESAQGWRWYNEPRAPQQPEMQPTPPPQPTMSMTQTPEPTTRNMTATEQMAWFQQYMAEVQNEAVINPSVENVMAFMKISHFIDGKTTDFGMAWKEALLVDPELSYRTKYPTESLARKTHNAMTVNAKEQAVVTMAEQGYGLFFMYNGKSPLDAQLAPSVQAFADQYGIGLLGLSMDGELLTTLNNTRNNDGKLNVPSIPALILVNPKTNEIKPLAYGFISQDELLGRFLNIATDYAPDF